jgi:hypothetical protein
MYIFLSGKTNNSLYQFKNNKKSIIKMHGQNLFPAMQLLFCYLVISITGWLLVTSFGRPGSQF